MPRAQAAVSEDRRRPHTQDIVSSPSDGTRYSHGDHRAGWGRVLEEKNIGRCDRATASQGIPTIPAVPPVALAPPGPAAPTGATATAGTPRDNPNVRVGSSAPVPRGEPGRGEPTTTSIATRTRLESRDQHGRLWPPNGRRRHRQPVFAEGATRKGERLPLLLVDTQGARQWPWRAVLHKETKGDTGTILCLSTIGLMKEVEEIPPHRTLCTHRRPGYTENGFST